MSKWRFWRIVSFAAVFCMVFGPNGASLFASERTTLSAGGMHSMAIGADGSLWGWGCSEWGQLGTGVPPLAVAVPMSELGVAVVGVIAGAAIGAKLGVIGGPKGIAFGKIAGAIAGGVYGGRAGREIGAWIGAGRIVPTQVEGADWVSVSAGGIHSAAIRSDGSLWAWGNNFEDQLGNNAIFRRFAFIPNIDDRLPRMDPEQIGADRNWASVSAGALHTVATRTDGSLWAWGNNAEGQLGDGTQQRRRSPTRIGTDTGWRSVSAGALHTVAIRADGSLWAWGDNEAGQLGDGTTTSRRSPARIGRDYNWAFVSAGVLHTVAIRTDGTLWAWGANESAQLGNGTSISQPAPVQIGTATNWTFVSAGGFHSVGIKADGSLWTWGSNEDGRTGIGITVREAPFPVRIGEYYDWVSAAAGGAHTIAVKADGSIWAWGNNGEGQLGDASPGQNRLTPVFVKN